MLGEKTPEQLVNTIIYLLGIHFALRGGDEHKSLKVGVWSHITIKFDETKNLKYLEYRAPHVKNNQGGLKDRKRKEKVVQAYENYGNPDRCVVRLYEEYLGLRPNHNPKCSHDLYLRPLAKVPNVPYAPWYSCQAMGLHAIQSVLSGMCARGGIGGKRTNHALKATAASRMYNNNFDEQLICEQLGNSSEAVRSYKWTSTDQKIAVSQTLYGQAKKPKLEVNAKKVPSDTVVVSKPKPVQEDNPVLSCSQVFQVPNCVFAITKCHSSVQLFRRWCQQFAPNQCLSNYKYPQWDCVKSANYREVNVNLQRWKVTSVLSSETVLRNVKCTENPNLCSKLCWETK